MIGILTEDDTNNQGKRSKALNLEGEMQIEEEAFEKTIRDLQDEIEGHKLHPMQEAPLIPSEIKLKRFDYLQELSEQIRERNLAKQQELEERRRPGISNDMNGYPNLPIVSPEQKRAHKIAQINALKAGLDNQIKEKQEIQKKMQEDNAELERQVLAHADNNYKSQENFKSQQKKKEREMLENFWQKATLTKKLKYLIENPHKIKTNNHIDNSSTLSQAQSARSYSSRSSVKSYGSRSTVKSYQLKARQIKERLEQQEREEYERKIKKMISKEKNKKKSIYSQNSEKSTSNHN